MGEELDVLNLIVKPVPEVKQINVKDMEVGNDVLNPVVNPVL
jgi:hypothetical protein